MRRSLCWQVAQGRAEQQRAGAHPQPRAGKLDCVGAGEAAVGESRAELLARHHGRRIPGAPRLASPRLASPRLLLPASFIYLPSLRPASPYPLTPSLGSWQVGQVAAAALDPSLLNRCRPDPTTDRGQLQLGLSLLSRTVGGRWGRSALPFPLPLTLTLTLTLTGPPNDRRDDSYSIVSNETGQVVATGSFPASHETVLLNVGQAAYGVCLCVCLCVCLSVCLCMYVWK